MKAFAESIGCIDPFEKEIYKTQVFFFVSMLLLKCVYLVFIRKTERERESICSPDHNCLALTTYLISFNDGNPPS
jgi:hypothetical protein